jgi:hypothetical protein
MKSREGTLSDDRPRRPALATGLPTHRASERQASPRRRKSRWSRLGLLLTALVLAAIGVGVLLRVSGASDGNVARPFVTVEPVLEAGNPVPPDTAASSPVEGQSTDAGPVLAVEPVNTAVPVSAPLTPVAPTATRTPAPATATPAPATATPAPEPTSTLVEVWVGNTGGSGVYVRNTASVVDRIRAYPDGTRLTIIGADVPGDGQQWKHVRTPDGLEGYVPSIYATDAAP